MPERIVFAWKILAAIVLFCGAWAGWVVVLDYHFPSLLSAIISALLMLVSFLAMLTGYYWVRSRLVKEE